MRGKHKTICDILDDSYTLLSNINLFWLLMQPLIFIWLPELLSKTLYIPISTDRLADFYIRVGQTFNETSFDPTTYTLCHYHSIQRDPGETAMFICDHPVKGKYVTVHFPKSKAERLTLCKVAVFQYTGEG